MIVAGDYSKSGHLFFCKVVLPQFWWFYDKYVGDSLRNNESYQTDFLINQSL